ncbi:MAG: methionyl-tRNA formyltransferase [Phascolarctobacterium sp.]|nr:MAG: methionyl-tRNA formyltransferase [Phascolarctobacterium sp.]
MRIVFMGTPDFAVASLKALAERGTDEIVGVFTQPDRPKGRGQKMLMTPVKEYALERGFEVYQPQRVKTPEVIGLLQGLAPDLIVVAAFGQFLPKEILEMPKYGCINVHASLLPKYRGAAPIHYAILNGETESGVTIMQMDIGMDTGDMLTKVKVAITPEMTMGELHDELKEQGGALLLETIEKIKRGEITPVKQNNDEATYAHLLTREMEIIDWSLPAEQIHNKIRAFNPAPGNVTTLPDGKKLKIWRARLAEGSGAPGKVLEVLKTGFKVACGSGALLVTEVQPESKKRMQASVFCNGRGINAGDILGVEG